MIPPMIRSLGNVVIHLIERFGELERGGSRQRRNDVRDSEGPGEESRFLSSRRKAGGS